MLGLSGCSPTPSTPDASGGAAHSPDQRLAPCPSSPNCISSRDSDTPDWVLLAPATEAWPQIVEAVNGLGRTSIVVEDGYYLRAESKSRLFGFIDDLELAIDEQGDSRVAFRSASRLGYSDLGVNQRRITAVYDALQERGLVQ
jgi:uncharacterized protein (DUF1499 family)